MELADGEKQARFLMIPTSNQDLENGEEMEFVVVRIGDDSDDDNDDVVDRLIRDFQPPASKRPRAEASIRSGQSALSPSELPLRRKAVAASSMLESLQRVEASSGASRPSDRTLFQRQLQLHEHEELFPKPNNPATSLNVFRRNLHPGKNSNKEKEEATSFFCHVCDAVFQKEFSLAAHILQHRFYDNGGAEMGKTKTAEPKAVVKKEKGGVDDPRTPNIITLEGSYNTIAGRGLFKCGECGKLFRNIGHLHTHLDDYHEIPEEDRVESTQIIREEDPVSGALRYICVECGERFFECEALNKHYYTHMESPFKCKQCDRAFWQNTDLQRHNIRFHRRLPDVSAFQRDYGVAVDNVQKDPGGGSGSVVKIEAAVVSRTMPIRDLEAETTKYLRDDFCL